MLHLEFEPHSWYMGHAIQDDRKSVVTAYNWYAYYANGMTGYIVTHEANTLADLKQQIKEYNTNETARIKRLYEGVK